VIWLALPAVAAAAYYALAVVAAARWSQSSPGSNGSANQPPVSILKPVHGRDPRFWDAIRSHAEQRYPGFEILFGVASPDDPALEDIRRLEREYPALPIRTHIVSTSARNAKVGVLAELARQARYPMLVVNDSDIRVPPGYLAAVTAPLADPEVGLVTCLYRAAADSWPARAEALGIATEFAPSVLVARLLGVAEFALGSTMAFRSATLAEIGGFEAISDYLADDYQLGCRIHERGYRIRFAPVVVETNLGGGGWAEVWRHQLRWSRTIRVSRPSGYFGYAITHATFWAAVALAGGQWPCALLALALRMWAGIWTGAGILRDPKTARDFWLIPLRDLAGFAVWLAGLFGDSVDWRGQKLRLLPNGKIRSESP